MIKLLKAFFSKGKQKYEQLQTLENLTNDWKFMKFCKDYLNTHSMTV